MDVNGDSVPGNYTTRKEMAFAQINAIYQKVVDNNGIYDRIVKAEMGISNLTCLPSIAKTLRLQTYIIGALSLFVAAIVSVIVIKGTNIQVRVPGWFEINGNYNDHP